MPTDAGSYDYYTPEEKHRLNAEWRDSEAGRRFYKSVKREEQKATVARVFIAILAGLIAILLGAAALKWAFEELAK